MIHDTTAAERAFIGCLLRSPHDYWQVSETVTLGILEAYRIDLIKSGGLPPGSNRDVGSRPALLREGLGCSRQKLPSDLATSVARLKPKVPACD